jgi:hypothetical protein
MIHLRVVPLELPLASPRLGSPVTHVIGYTDAHDEMFFGK